MTPYSTNGTNYYKPPLTLNIRQRIPPPMLLRPYQKRRSVDVSCCHVMGVTRCSGMRHSVLPAVTSKRYCRLTCQPTGASRSGPHASVSPKRTDKWLLLTARGTHLPTSGYLQQDSAPTDRQIQKRGKEKLIQVLTCQYEVVQKARPPGGLHPGLPPVHKPRGGGDNRR